MEELEAFTRKTLYFLIGSTSMAIEGVSKALEDWGNQTQAWVDELVQEGEDRYIQWTQEQTDSATEDPWERSPNPGVPLAPSETIRHRLMTLVRGDRALAERLLLQEKQSNPGQTDRWYWEKVIYDLERDLQG